MGITNWSLFKNS